MTRFFWRRFIGTWLIALLSLQLSRLVFYINLQGYFNATYEGLVDAFMFGFWFDAVSIAYLLGLFFLALPFLRKGWPETVAKWFFLVMLGAMNLLNCIDAEFYKFTSRRSTDDLFEFAFISDDIFNIAPNLLSHFWYLLAAFLAIMFLCLWLMNRLLSTVSKGNSHWKNAVSLFIVVASLIIGARGGFGRIPLTIIDAGKTDHPHLNAITLSTPFTILKTLGKPELKIYDFSTAEMVDLDPIIHPRSTPYHGRLRGNNVVVVIVESLSTEYVGALNGLDHGFTPFIDSLCSVSMVFENGFANGHRSIEGIPAVVASIPTLMYEPYTTSRYAGNRINSLANLLGDEGYYSTFMHGGNKNSMNFESFAGQAGYDLFYDRDDYPFPDEHYDGFWGISDHYFLNHCIDKYTEFKKPFFSSIFTLSSHHPYSLPKEYRDKFPKGTLPIHESLGYTDDALRQFFAKAAKTDWYSNTLFVITADHTSLSEHHEYQTKLGSLKIPIIFFHPTDSMIAGRHSQIVQQADIMPTILGLLGYEKPFFSFGVDAFDDEAEHVAIAFKHDQHQVLVQNQLICFDGEEVSFVYNADEDLLLRRNLLNDTSVSFDHSERYLKAYLKNYSEALTENRMTFETWGGQLE
jgi:phosphoglycerol transferase MdoB-like AlkP superfamily enzyme